MNISRMGTTLYEIGYRESSMNDVSHLSKASMLENCSELE